MGRKMDVLIARYLELQKQFGHAPRRRLDRPAYDRAQRELWQLAQAICTLAHPDIQAELDAARRDVMAQVRLHVEHIGPVTVQPKASHRPLTWTDFQLSPEISLDMAITGASVTADVAKRLRVAHKLQISMVYAVAHKAR